jgi:Fibronectin type III domain
MGRKERLSLGAIVVLVLGAGLSPVLAAGAAPPAPPTPTQGSSQPNLGIFSERRDLLAHRPAGKAQARPLAPKTSVCAAAWRVVDSPNGTWNNYMGGIGAVTPTDMWAVGASQSATTGNYQDLAEHWDGSAWGVVPTPEPGPDGNFLNDVAAIATGDVWAVGVSNTTGFLQGMALHWNGTAWAQVATPGLPSRNLLNDVAAVSATNVWAVGQQDRNDSSGLIQTLIEHWDGTSWAVVPSVDPGTGDNVLFGVGASSATDIWAVGYSSDTLGQRQSLAEHWNGTSWTITSSPNTANEILHAVAATSTTEAVAVGLVISGANILSDTRHWNGTTWEAAPSFNQPGVFSSFVNSVVAASATDYWAVGTYVGGTSLPGGPLLPFALHGNGTSWTTMGLPSNGADDNEANGVAAPAAGDVWAVGSYINPQVLSRSLIENFSGLAAPTSAAATSGDQSAVVTWAAPCGDGGSAITSYVVTAYDGCTIQGSVTVSGAPPGATTSFPSLGNGTAYTFKVAAVNSFGVGPQSAASNKVTPSGATGTWVSACSLQQYHLTGSNGAAWQSMDATNLGVSFTPSVDSFAVVSGNVDLFTAKAGFNQDIGIAVNGGGVYPRTAGQPEAWKESGGFAGTFSPNAAYVETVIPVAALTAYTATLQWKTNKPDAGTVYAGAGPIEGAYSPTRITVRLIPVTSGTILSKSSTAQYKLTHNNGSAWPHMDTTKLTLQFTPPAGDWRVIVSGNADLFTGSAGYNQDIGIGFSGGPYTASPLPVGWEESGGFAGTFSPNAAYVEAFFAVTGGTTYTADLRWKANKFDTGSIYAGAGPINGKFSPTTLTVLMVPFYGLGDSEQQFNQRNSDGSYWQEVDPAHQIAFSPIAGNWLLSVNADLFTSVAGYNQDIGIMVSGGAFGAGTVVAWKESGGFAGTYSPNAAFLATVLHLQAGPVYTVWAVWKANRLAQVPNTIWAGAGPIGNFSGTVLVAQLLS